MAKLGEPAPDFSLPSQQGTTVRLRDYLEKKAVVLYFYPKDDTPGCTKESCSFRDAFEVFQQAGAEVIGVSSDSVESHQKFAKKYQLPFLLLSDADGKLRKTYQVPTTFGWLPGRVTYLIDKQGIIRQIFNSQFHPTRHVEEALKILYAEPTRSVNATSPR